MISVITSECVIVYRCVSLYIYVHAYVCMYAYIYIHMYVYINICVCVIHMSIHVCICVYICISLSLYIYIYIINHEIGEQGAHWHYIKLTGVPNKSLRRKTCHLQRPRLVLTPVVPFRILYSCMRMRTRNACQ